MLLILKRIQGYDIQGRQRRGKRRMTNDEENPYAVGRDSAVSVNRGAIEYGYRQVAL